MKKFLRLVAVILLLAAGLTWLATGANRGWTKTSIPVKTLDDVTGLEGLNYEKRFVPGLDFLGAAFLASALLGGISFVFRHKNKPQIPT